MNPTIILNIVGLVGAVCGIISFLKVKSLEVRIFPKSSPNLIGLETW